MEPPLEAPRNAEVVEQLQGFVLNMPARPRRDVLRREEPVEVGRSLSIESELARGIQEPDGQAGLEGRVRGEHQVEAAISNRSAQSPEAAKQRPPLDDDELVHIRM